MDDKTTLHLGPENQAMNLRDRLFAAKNRAIELGLTKERGWKRAMATAAGCSPQNITQATSDTSSHASMRPELLRRIAIWARMNEAFMVFGTGPQHSSHDVNREVFDAHAISQSAIAASAPPLSGDSEQRLSAVTSAFAAPRISRVGRKGDVLYRANNEWPKTEQWPFLTKKECSEYCKFVLVPDDDMAPHIKRGDWVLIDPNAEPLRGKTCLFLLPDDSYVLRTYEVIAGGGYEARDAAGRTLSRERHGIVYAGRYVLMQREDE
jgi:hypothetical protein